MSKKLDDAVAAVLAASQPPGCWASRLEGDAAEFIRRLREEESKGVKVSRAASRDILKQVWEVEISEDALRNHMKRRCSCD